MLLRGTIDRTLRSDVVIIGQIWEYEKLIDFMGAIHIMNIKDKDLNLLYIFDTLMRELSVSRAAKLLKMTQPAVSNALTRLRRDFGDDLLVRNGRGMSATPKAQAIQEDVAAILESSRALYDTEDFDPHSVVARFTIATTDYFESVLLPRLLPLLGQSAPGITTIVRPTRAGLPKSDLESGQLDLAVAGFYGDLPEGFYQRTLFEESYSCLVRKGHPIVGNELTLEKFVKLEHILVSPQGDLRGAVDLALEAKGLSRRVVAGVANFHTPPAIIADSDYIVTIPTRLAAQFARLYSLNCFQPPIPVKKIKLVQVWHARTHRSPQHKWLRGAVESALEPAQINSLQGPPDGTKGKNRSKS